VAAAHSALNVDVSGITSSSLVLATLQKTASGVYVAGAVPTTGHFTLYLNRTVPVNMKFAWFIIN
jgi:hypothetical protein